MYLSYLACGSPPVMNSLIKSIAVLKERAMAPIAEKWHCLAKGKRGSCCQTSSFTVSPSTLTNLMPELNRQNISNQETIAKTITVMFVPPLPAVLFSDILSKGQALFLPQTDRHRKKKKKKSREPQPAIGLVRQEEAGSYPTQSLSLFK